MTYENGDVFEGTFDEDQIVGMGSYTCLNGDKYIGNWLDSKWHGEGHLVSGSNEYKGLFIRHKKEGFGEMKYMNGSKYTGEWKADKVIF